MSDIDSLGELGAKLLQDTNRHGGFYLAGQNLGEQVNARKGEKRLLFIQ